MSAGRADRRRRDRKRVRRDRSRGARERGGTLLIVTLMIVPLVIITALVVDIGYAKAQRRAIQATADAAALAAAHELRDTGEVDDAIRAAKDWAAKNDADLTDESWIGCRDSGALADGHDGANENECISFELGDELRKVRVRIPEAIQPQFFGQVGDVSAVRVSALAEAGFVPATPSAPEPPTVEPGPCGLCVIGGARLQMAGGLQVNVVGGKIQGDQLTANMQDDNLNITPVPLGWHASNGSNWGRNYRPGNPAYSFANRYEKLTAPVPDPFPPELAVDYSGLSTSGANLNLPSGSQAIQPDTIYTQNVNINSGTITLQPNRTYYFANTLNMNGGKLKGAGVTLVFGCTSTCNNQERGKINVGSSATVEITAPTGGPYAGLAILFDPTATGQGNNLNGTLLLEGAVYARKAGLNSSNSTYLEAWTVVTGANSNYNGGTFQIDNTKYAGGSQPPAEDPDPAGGIEGGGRIQLLG